MAERQRFLEASALAAAEHLSAEEAVWMGEQLQLHPEWADDVHAHARVVQAAREATLREAEDSPLLSFEAVMAAMPLEVSAAPAADLAGRASRAAPAHTTLLDRLEAWWRRPSTMGLALASLAVLALLTAVQTRRADDAQRRVEVASAQLAAGPAYRGAGAPVRTPLTLRLDPTMPLGAMIELLRQQQLLVVDGPNAEGVFLVETPSVDAEARIVALRQNPQVLSVQRVVSVP